MGLLRHLRQLHLNANHITGKVPDSLSKLAELESLNLSDNNLVGTVPLLATNLQHLSLLHLAQNQFDDKIVHPDLQALEYELGVDLWVI